jgi:hypothetical protein
MNQIYFPINYMNSTDYKDYVEKRLPETGEIMKKIGEEETKERK